MARRQQTDLRADAALIKATLVLYPELSQREVAKRLGMAKSTVNRWATSPLVPYAVMAGSPDLSRFDAEWWRAVDAGLGDLAQMRQGALIYDGERGIGSEMMYPAGVTRESALVEVREATDLITQPIPRDESAEDAAELAFALRAAKAKARTFGAANEDLL